MIEPEDIAFVMDYTIEGDNYVVRGKNKVPIKLFDPIGKTYHRVLFEKALDRKLITLLKEYFSEKRTDTRTR